MIDSGREDIVLVDVRTPLEFGTGYIAGAMLIPYTEIERRANEIPRDKTVIVYCTVGVRSERARKRLLELGFPEVLNFKGTSHWPYELVKPEPDAGWGN
jgi:rhodanese-related sulfurtransferase